MKEEQIGKYRIRVAIVSESMNIGGGEMMAARLATYIDSEKFEVKLFIIGKKQNNQILRLIEDSNIKYECLGLPTSFNMRAYKLFAKAISGFEPDIIHEHLDACYSWIWCILHNKPLIATMHSDPYRRKSKRVEIVMRIKALQKNLRVIGCSQKTAELVKSCYSLPEECVTYIHNPIDLAKYRVSKHQFEEFRFVHIGRFHEVKNHKLLINAYSRAFNGDKRIKLFLVGEGPLNEDIKAMVRSMGLDEVVEFMGNIDNIPELLENMDVLLLSSRSEAFPMVILEGMAAGLPIISTNVGGVSEAVTDNGILVESDNEVEFAEALHIMVNSREQFERFIEKAINNVKQFDKDIISRKYELEYNRLSVKDNHSQI